MKPKNQHTHHPLIWILILSSCIFSLGCENTTDSRVNKTESNKDISNTVSETVIQTKPKIDLHTAVISNNTEVVKHHILVGTDINQKDPFGGSSPLINAALFDHKDVAELLINAGADLNFTNNDGSTALITAAFFCRTDIVQLLLDNGADKTIKNNDGSTAYDAVSGPFQVVKPIYDMIGQALAPMGLVLDYKQLEATRPTIAALLK